LQIVGEVLLELGFGAAGQSFRERTRADPVAAGIGVVLMGAVAGVIASLAWPRRILQPGPVRGLSLIASPIVTGIVMERYGQWREDSLRSRSYLATFWGGALFAFSMALVRFVWVGKYNH
jgi:cytochrome c biogenesis protein CcdA